MYNLGFGTSIAANANSSNGGGGSTSLYGRVVHVILDPFDPDYEKYGSSQSINGVLYKPLNTPTEESKESDLLFAYCGGGNMKRIPLKGEIVKLELNPTEERTDNPSSKKTYWVDIVSIWNHPHHNAYPDTYQSGDNNNQFGSDFIEAASINPLQAFPGDTLLEGRHGQSIRFTGTKYQSNPWIDSTNNGKPLTIISNGQIETDNGVDSIVEDVNEDSSTMYFTSEHIIPLLQASEKRAAWKEEPIKADKYKESQIILNSGRLYFNAKDNDILLSSKEGIGLNSNTISLDGEEYIGLDADKIYLGKIALEREDEPVLLGQSTTDLLEDFLKQFQSLIRDMASMPPAPPAAIAKMIATSNAILPEIPKLKQRLPLLHSKKVYTE